MSYSTKFCIVVIFPLVIADEMLKLAEYFILEMYLQSVNRHSLCLIVQVILSVTGKAVQRK